MGAGADRRVAGSKSMELCMIRSMLGGMGVLVAATVLHGQTPVAPAPASAVQVPQVPSQPTKAAIAPRAFVATLVIGAPAPVLGINVWIKGAPVNEYKPGTIYVVEFWSPRVAACRRSGPLLSELAALYKDSGVTIISVATVEQQGPGVVDAYVKQMGEKITHTVGYDTTGDTTRRYMQPSGQSGIPVAFVVNERGQIAWIGHPMDNLDRVLAKMTSGSWDLIKANDEARRKAAAEEKSGPLVMRLEEEFAAGQTDKALATMDQLFAIDPPVMGEWAMTKFAYLLMQKRDADMAYAYAAAMLEGGLKDDPETLKAIAWMTLAEPGVVQRNIPLARQMAQRADELTKHADANILDTLAKAQFESGDIKGAVETQKLAVEAATLPSQKKELEQRLRQYVVAKKVETSVKQP